MTTETSPLNRQPDKLDYSSPTQFRFILNQIPTVQFFVQTANIPGISLGEAVIPTPYKDIPYVGDKVTYESLNVQFLVDEHLDTESLKNQEIKAKYLEHKSKFELLLFKAKGDYKRLYREKWEYYGGKSDAKIYATKPFDLKVLKTDLSIYISADEEIIDAENKIGYLETVIDYIKGVIKSVDNRGWDIKNVIEWKKFEAGLTY